MTSVQMKGSPEPPSELLRSRPRDVRLTAAGRTLAFVSAALFVGAVVVTIVLSREAARQRHDREAFDVSGRVASARVVRLWRESNEQKTRWVSYAFDIDGRQFEGRSKLPRAWWESLNVNSSLNVRYVASDPGRNEVANSPHEVLPAWLPVVVGIALAIFGGLCAYGIQKQRTLLANGRVALATVTRVTKHHTTHGGSYRSIRFNYPLLSGAIASGKSTARKGNEVGSSIWVVYDPDQPGRSAIYPLQLVTIATG